MFGGNRNFLDVERVLTKGSGSGVCECFRDFTSTRSLR
jgi:hypothetical protein